MPQHITLSELQSLIKRGIDDAHPLPYWVTAEISELKVNYSGHCYLELVEKGGANHVPKAKISAVIWRSTYGMIASYFGAATGGQTLCAGLKVLVKALVSYHELYGLSLQITDIDPSYTLGDMERQRRQTIEQLQRDGVFDMNRELPMPAVVQRLAVVSSRNAAGYQDFMKELSSGPYRFEVTLFDAFMREPSPRSRSSGLGDRGRRAGRLRCGRADSRRRIAKRSGQFRQLSAVLPFGTVPAAGDRRGSAMTRTGAWPIWWPPCRSRLRRPSPSI